MWSAPAPADSSANADSNAEVEFDEYITACYGTTEYPEDMTCVKLFLKDETCSEQVIDYNYKCRQADVSKAVYASAEIGAINTRMDFEPEEPGTTGGYIKEGYAFSPMFTLGLKKKFNKKGEFVTWLRLKKAK